MIARTLRRILTFLCRVGIAILVVADLLQVPSMGQSVENVVPQGQTALTLQVPDWQVAAGGHMEFDVASVKRDTAEPNAQTMHTNFPLDVGYAYTSDAGHLLAANFPLTAYIGFAYRLTWYQSHLLDPQLPKWATTNRYDVEARAEDKPTKDQMRLMVQALLADRFKLAVHFETRQLPVFVIVLDKPEKLGPHFQQHSDDPPCGALASAPARVATPLLGEFPSICDVLVVESVPGGGIKMSARHLTIDQIISDLVVPAGLDRDFVNKTSLGGKFDFSIEFVREPNALAAQSQPEPSGPTFLQALKEQLGLRLESDKGPVTILAIDRIEEPSEN